MLQGKSPEKLGDRPGRSFKAPTLAKKKSFGGEGTLWNVPYFPGLGQMEADVRLAARKKYTEDRDKVM